MFRSTLGAAARHSGEDLKSEITMACCSSQGAAAPPEHQYSSAFSPVFWSRDPTTQSPHSNDDQQPQVVPRIRSRLQMIYRRILVRGTLGQGQVIQVLLRNSHPKHLHQSYASFAVSLAECERAPPVPIIDSHPGLMKDVRRHFQNAGLATGIQICHALREHYPDHIVVETPEDTGILEIAKAGLANVTLDTDAEYYVSRRYKQAKE